MDETRIKIKGEGKYLCRALDKQDNTAPRSAYRKKGEEGLRQESAPLAASKTVFDGMYRVTISSREAQAETPGSASNLSC